MASFYDFGVKTLSKVVDYRGGNIPSYICNSNGYSGKKLWYNSSLYTCVRSTTNTITINILGKEKTVNRRDCLAPKGTIPKYKKKTASEILDEIQVNYPNAKLYIPKVGCQLHGDIDAELTIDNQTYYIPWNY